MTLPDVNVLLYAFVPDSTGHRQSRDWLSGTVNGNVTFGLSPQILSSFIRIGSHPKIYRNRYTVAELIVFAQTLLDLPHCHAIEPGQRHWSIFCDLCRLTGASGSLVPDAWFAALAIEHDCEWVTADRDFARFPGLRWRRLLQDPRPN